jgi:acyl dehydratase
VPERPLFFEEIEIGTVLVANTPYLVTAEEIKEVARRWDPQPFHLDEAAGEASHFGGLVGSGAHSIAISICLGNEEVPGTAAVAGLGIDELRFIAPIRPGDRLTQTDEIIDARPSGSRPQWGIVRGQRTLRNQDGVTVLTCVVTWAVERAPR